MQNHHMPTRTERSPRRRTAQILLAMIMTCNVFTAHAYAQGDKGAEVSAKERLAELREMEVRPPKTWFPDTPVDSILNLHNKLRLSSQEELGLSYGGGYTLFFHQGTKRDDATNLQHYLEFFGSWSPLGQDPNVTEGTLYFHVAQVRRLCGVGVDELSETLGITYAVNDSGGDNWFLRQLVWEQTFLEERIILGFGYGELALIFNGNRYAGDDTTSFIARPVATNPVRSWQPAIGFAGIVKPTEWLELGYGMVDASSNGQYPRPKDFGRGQFLHVWDAAIVPDVPGLGKGDYRFTAYYSEATKGEPSGSGAAISFSQDIGERWGLFLRGGISDRRHTDVKSVLSGGTVYKGPFGMTDDQIGLGAWWLRPTDSEVRSDEYGVEAYWRMQLTKWIEFTPDVQLIMHPAGNENECVEAVFGLRLRVSF